MKRLVALLLVFALAAPPVSVAVRPKFALTRSDIRLTVRIDPHEDNRALRTIIDGPQYMSQDEPLDGLEAPRIVERWFKAVPAGHYTAMAVVFRAGGKDYVARDTFCISGPDVECAKSEGH